VTTPAADVAIDVLVVGGGPAGLATAIELARRDRRVTVVDRRDPGVRTAMLLTPRAAAATRRLGIDLADHFHPIERVRFTAVDPDEPGPRSTSSPWPRWRGVPDGGFVGTRAALVDALRTLAVELGVEVLDRHDASEPIVERGFLRGAVVRAGRGTTRQVRATFTVVADGGNSQFGRLLGTFRQPDWPLAVAHGADIRSPLGLAGEAELVVGITDRAGAPIAGYGWMYPTGGDTVGVGIMLMSTSPSFRVINPAHLHERFVDDHAARWQLDTRSVTSVGGGRIPTGASVGPLAGPTFVIIGDAGAAANPLTGLGIDTALETGIMAGDVVGEALDTSNAAVLQQFPKQFDDRYGAYYKLGRLTERLLGRPAFARRVHHALGSRPTFAEGALRIATQHLRSGRGGVPELMYRAGRAAATFAPDA
jgi:flavin-dependent dehydrogenase